MIDTEVYLEKLSLFGRILQSEGFELSPKETEDAASILLDLGLSDRATTKTALRAVYAKSRDEQLRFDRIFDSFFISEDAIRAIDKKHQREELEKRKAIEEAEADLGKQNVLYNEEQKNAYANLSEEEKQHLRDLQKKYENYTERSAELYTGFIHSIFAKYILEEQIRMEDAALGAGSIDPEIGLLFRDIGEFSDKEIPKAVLYVKTLASQINGELSKARKSSGKSAALDFRRTIRKGLETGGSFYHLAFRKRKKKKKQLLILCDVSASMIQFSEFALRFIQALNDASDSSRVILFSEGFAEADKFHLQNMDLFREYVKQTGIYGKGTDLGSVLNKLNNEKPAAISSSTILIIVSDAKTINPERSCRELAIARSKAGKVICLNPIPERKWKYSSSILAAANYCDMLPCSNLAELGAACRRLALM